MGRKADIQGPDRHLTLRGGRYYYQRRVPTHLTGIVPGPLIKRSLKTSDLTLARMKRDVLEAADNDLWSSLTVNSEVATARRRYSSAVKRAEALGFQYRSALDIIQSGGLVEALTRIEAVEKIKTPQDVEAVLGLVETPKVKVSDAHDIYKNEIVADQLLRKSPRQRRDWAKVKDRAVETFKAVIGDIPMISPT
ncbi:hypothetical protein L598_009400000010 [Mesorhizobium sp. J18]|uniref:DUF6538 domain-containing protein n=1 Tax=Mesorhizobium sp. J18 TaxID=935263 RepID=UPI001199EFBA|nr:hypothetical protein L598_009400000010 [Mesorhizobium sp. J18]